MCAGQPGVIKLPKGATSPLGGAGLTSGGYDGGGASGLSAKKAMGSFRRRKAAVLPYMPLLGETDAATPVI